MNNDLAVTIGMSKKGGAQGGMANSILVYLVEHRPTGVVPSASLAARLVEVY
jgi:hypothetical protein